MAMIKVVYGPPCSGKSTYVNEVIKDKDVRFDYDLIMQSISNKKSHEYSDEHLPYVVEYRGLIIDKAEQDTVIETAYVIATRITDKLLEELEGKNVDYHLIDSTKDECYSNLENDDTRQDKDFWKEKIDSWFEWYELYEKGVKNMMSTKVQPIVKSKQTPLMTVKNLTSTSADLYIYGEIVDNTDWKWDETEVMPDDVLNALNQVNGLDELNIYINSPGGSVFAGLAIYNMLSRNKAKKKVYVDGVAASMASVIAMAGDEIYIPSNAFLMIHNPWTFAMGNAKDLRKIADDLDQIATGAMNVYKDNLVEGVEESTIKEMLDNETWLNGNEAAKYFNVNVIEAKNYAASASDVLKKYGKTPQTLITSKQLENVDLKDTEKIKFQNELDLLEL